MIMRIIFATLLFFSLNSIAMAQVLFSPEAKDAENILAQGLKEKSPEKRKEAVVALSLEGARPSVFLLLEAALEDEDVPVRLAACSSLAALKDPQSIKPLEKALNDRVPEVVFAAAQGLWQLNNPKGREVLVAILAGEQKYGSSSISRQKRDFMRNMKTPSGFFKFAAKMGLDFVPLPGFGTGVSSMELLLKDDGISGRALAALLLSRDEDPSSLELLKDALNDKDWTVRAAAIHALALRNQPELRGDILPLMSDKKEQVRYRAAAAYLRLEQLSKTNNSHKKSKSISKKRIPNKPAAHKVERPLEQTGR